LTQGTGHAEAHAATSARIVTAARELLVRHGEVTLRAVARQLGMTAPALYRYAPSRQELVRTVAIAIDADVATRIKAAANAQAADDPAARLIAAEVEFRAWALENRQEFRLVFTTIEVDSLDEMTGSASTGTVFSGLLLELWAKRQLPIPQLDELDPDLAHILRDRRVPPGLGGVPDELRGLLWALERTWSRLYAGITLEVFGHVDPRIVEEGHLFREIIDDQARPLGLIDELQRLHGLLDSLLAAQRDTSRSAASTPDPQPGPSAEARTRASCPREPLPPDG
jgi:AcrR family transcriptional regulator